MIRLYHSQYGDRSLVCLPATLRESTIKKFHTEYYGGHEGALKITQRLQLYYLWPNMKEDVQRTIAKVARNVIICLLHPLLSYSLSPFLPNLINEFMLTYLAP